MRRLTTNPEVMWQNTSPNPTAVPHAIVIQTNANVKIGGSKSKKSIKFKFYTLLVKDFSNWEDA